MAIPNTAVWRVRAGGSNVNGGGYDPSVSGVQSTTLNGAISAAATTVVVASATGWPGSGNYYARIGNDWKSGETFSSGGTGSSEVVLVTAGQGTTTWTVTRARLGTVAQAFATGVVVDNELSRCNTAIASGTVGTSTASTTFTDAAAAFDSTYIGNVLWIASGTGATVGAYVIQSVTNATTVVLDGVSGTYTAGVWKVGGAWATAQNFLTQAGPIVSGNMIYFRAGGSGTPAAPDFTTSYIYTANGSTADGYVRIIGENGRPIIKGTTGMILFLSTMIWRENMYFCAGSATFGSYGLDYTSGVAIDMVYDQNGFDVNGLSAATVAIRCEVFSSVVNSGVAGGYVGIMAEGFAGKIFNCNVHDCWGIGVTVSATSTVEDTIVANNKGTGVKFLAFDAIGYIRSLIRCTIDNNGGHGIEFSDAAGLSIVMILGNIISNHTGFGKYGIHCNFGSTAANDRIRTLIDNNTWFNNTANSLNLTIANGQLSGHNYVNNIGVNPGYVAQSTQNYAIGTALENLGFPQAAFLQSKSGQTTGVRNYMSPGAVQPAPSAGGTTIINTRATSHARR